MAETDSSKSSSEDNLPWIHITRVEVVRSSTTNRRKFRYVTGTGTKVKIEALKYLPPYREWTQNRVRTMAERVMFLSDVEQICTDLMAADLRLEGPDSCFNQLMIGATQNPMTVRASGGVLYYNSTETVSALGRFGSTTGVYPRAIQVHLSTEGENIDLQRNTLYLIKGDYIFDEAWYCLLCAEKHVPKVSRCLQVRFVELDALRNPHTAHISNAWPVGCCIDLNHTWVLEPLTTPSGTFVKFEACSPWDYYHQLCENCHRKAELDDGLLDPSECNADDCSSFMMGMDRDEVKKGTVTYVPHYDRNLRDKWYFGTNICMNAPRRIRKLTSKLSRQIGKGKANDLGSLLSSEEIFGYERDIFLRMLATSLKLSELFSSSHKCFTGSTTDGTIPIHEPVRTGIWCDSVLARDHKDVTVWRSTKQYCQVLNNGLQTHIVNSEPSTASYVFGSYIGTQSEQS